MKKTLYIVFLALGLLTACRDDVTPPYSVGEADNAITLRAGISEGGEITRAAGDVVYHKFEGATGLRLRVEGTWLGKDNYALPHGSVSNTLAKQITKATTAQDATVDSDHDTQTILDTHAITFGSENQLYWDDYGTADPANMSNTDGGTITDGSSGRDKGLTIYGVAINGQSLPDALSENVSWADLSWTLPGDQKGGWLANDLLTSNNVTESNNNTYKFNNRAAGKLLEFTHAMTKITVNLTAGEGFPGYETGATNAKFQTAPKVTLLGFNYTGTVSVEAKTSTPTAATTNIEAYRDNGAAWTSGGQHTSQFTALVFPGNQFTATIADDAPNYTPTSSDPLLELNADGNIYKVTAAQLVKAIVNGATGSQNGTLEQGKNYILNITVNKTKIVVTATIKDWDDVNTEEALPKINVTHTYGHDGNAFTNDFDFFRSTTKANGYSKDAYVAHAEPTTGTHTYTFHNQLYWPNHQTHYFFRGVYPRVQTNIESGWIPAAKVSTSTSSASTIAVENVAYSVGTYPSDLALGWPRTANDAGDDETCKVHTSAQGICATEGNIYMNFRYVMSKVQVSLKSSGTAAEGNIVDLNNVVVEIINGNKSGKIRLSDGLHENFEDADKGDYILHQLSTPETNFSITTLDAIVPQVLDDDVKIRITVTNTNSTTDVYETQLNQIKVKTNDNSGALITEWKPGNYYKYELDLKKTAIKVSATITDWVTVTASENVWF